MGEIDFSEKELTELTAIVREGAAAMVQGWNVLTNIGTRIGCDWEPDEDGRNLAEIMEFFASNMTTPEEITPDAVKEAFGRIQDWQSEAI